MIEPLETERLCLRPITLDDVDLLVALDVIPTVMRYISGGKPTPRDEAERIVAAVARSPLARRSSDDSDEFVGWFGLRPSAGRDP